MLTLESLVAIIGGFIQAPLDHPLLRMMRRGSEIAVKFPQVLYISMGFGQTEPALQVPAALCATGKCRSSGTQICRVGHEATSAHTC